MDNEIPDKSINLIIADPPYFEVKGEFDFIWPSFDAYLQDVEKWAIECKRILADNGCLFWWGNVEKIAYSQIIIDRYFKLENVIIWHKPDSMQYQYYSRELARRFTTNNERILFYSNEKNVNAFSIEIKKGMQKYNLKEMDFRKLKQSQNGNPTGWCSNIILGKSIPTEEDWILICSLIRKGNNYKHLLQEYEELRRSFDNIYDLSDIITQSQESTISKGYDHETIKPLKLTKKLIQTTTRKGDMVLIPFGGSGTEVEACIDTGREYICYETKKKHYDTIKEREYKALLQPELCEITV